MGCGVGRGWGGGGGGCGRQVQEPGRDGVVAGGGGAARPALAGVVHLHVLVGVGAGVLEQRAAHGDAAPLLGAASATEHS